MNIIRTLYFKALYRSVKETGAGRGPVLSGVGSLGRYFRGESI